MEYKVCLRNFSDCATSTIAKNFRTPLNYNIISDMQHSLCFSPVQGGVDSRNLFHNYIMVWIQDMQLSLLDRCKAEKVVII